MGIFSKSLDQAQAAVTKAESVVQEWEGKAAAAREEAARLDAESGAMILADESAAERVTLNIQAHERRARAFDGAASEARQKLHQAQREALEVEAREEDKLAATDRKNAATHAAKVQDLKRQLEDLDGCEWARADAPDITTGRPSGHQQIGKSGSLEHTAHRHETRAAVIRYFLATGNVAHDFYLLDNELGTSLNTIALSFGQGDYIPKSVYAARSAGLNFAGAGA
ncbi:hypothetical protein HTS88_15660 [Pseudarthrobacter oxydans]|uniref:hypothetical protein n=1 Tax=Pseudarthrobacter oxydans TaxID=1671 RepID=UPI0015727929|nr:hypothetical protein [Pseudarthrobacter oxydans]NSX37820.1 hypothetical protein [Pseudarthrobacter oxydans]